MSARAPAIILSFAVGLFALGLALFPYPLHVSISSICLCAVALLIAKGNTRQLRFDLLGFELVLLALFCTNWFAQSWSFTAGEQSRIIILALTALTLPLFFKKPTWVWPLIAAATSVLLAFTFLIKSGGQLIVSDDHATFFYRLGLLKDNFPNIPFYYPLWNAGIDARDFFASGVLNFFLLTSPLTYLFDLSQVYNYNVALIVFGLAPAATYLAARLLNLARPAPALAAILALSVSTNWYRWTLAYGTMGFATSTALVPLTLALTIIALDRTKQLSLTQAVLVIIAASLLLCWTPAGLVFLPLICIGLTRIGFLFRKNYIKLILIALLAINLPWISIFWSASKVSNFLSANTANVSAPVSHTEPDRGSDFRHRSTGLDLQAALKIYKSTGLANNPAITLFGIAGLGLLIAGTTRLTFVLTSGWLLLLGTFGASLKPQLEFDRMILILGFVLCLPAALALASIWNKASSWPSRLRAAYCFGFVLFGLGVALHWSSGRGPQKISFAGEFSKEISSTINKEPDDYRIFFSGFILHELDGGHFAPLAYLNKRALVGSFPTHYFWKYHQSIPDQFLLRAKSGGIEEYLDFLNIGAVFAHEPYWRTYFKKRPKKYEETWRYPPFSFYRRKNFSSNYFLEGQGQILGQDKNSIRLRLTSPRAILKFNYFDFLESSACKLRSHRVSDFFDFIELSDCPINTEIEIKSKAPWQRVIQLAAKDLPQ